MHPDRVSTKKASVVFAGACLLSFSLLSCGTEAQKPQDKPFSYGPFATNEVHTFAGGVEVTGATLNSGYRGYMLYCYACHGESGDGQGPASHGFRPPPRDFTKGIFKFARVRSSDEMPSDEDLYRIVRGGLHGTPMLQWDVPDAELNKIIQYIKTFAIAKWEKKNKKGEPMKTVAPFEIPEDPWVGKEAAAVQLGKELYHLRAECVTCHPSYDTKEGMYKMSVEASKRDPEKFKALTGFRDDPYYSAPKDSAEYGVRIMPPDFTFNPLRSIRQGHTPEGREVTARDQIADLYRLISFGVYPIMPAWKGAGLSDQEIWALAHYVQSLMQMRGTEAATALKDKFLNQAAFEVPKPEPSAETQPAAEATPASQAAPAH